METTTEQSRSIKLDSFLKEINEVQQRYLLGLDVKIEITEKGIFPRFFVKDLTPPKKEPVEPEIPKLDVQPVNEAKPAENSTGTPA